MHETSASQWIYRARAHDAGKANSYQSNSYQSNSYQSNSYQYFARPHTWHGQAAVHRLNLAVLPDVIGCPNFRGTAAIDPPTRTHIGLVRRVHPDGFCGMAIGACGTEGYVQETCSIDS